ncbi:hypothetical protein KAR91_61640 [Candidatus Pacearchaeota archaeon]|nr:hypothetical protein [Candidatus Pacearchaeota archaeon]
MGKKRGFVIGSVLALVLVFNLALFSYRQSMSGMAARDIMESAGGLNISTILFFLQWIVLIILAIVIYFRFIKKGKEEKSKIRSALIKKRGFETETDFDTLYELLKEKKSLSVGAISELLKIKKELVMTWVKILESNELVVIEYPMFGDAEVVLKTKKKADDREEESEENGKNKKGKDEKKKGGGILRFFKKKKKEEITENAVSDEKQPENEITEKKEKLKKTPKKIKVSTKNSKSRRKKSTKAKQKVQNLKKKSTKNTRNLKTKKNSNKKRTTKKVKKNGGKK